LFHSPQELSDAELEVLNVKLQNMRRVPKFAAVFGFIGVACLDGMLLRRNPALWRMSLGAVAGYAFGGYGASQITNNMLTRSFDYDILIAQERRQQRKVMNLAGYNRDYISSDSTDLNKRFDKAYQ